MKATILSAALLAALGLQAANAQGLGEAAETLGGFGPMADFATLDADGDGLITAEELTAAGAARFAAADTDGDGALSPAEIAAAAEAARTARAEARMADRIARFDENGDGLLQLEEMQGALPMVDRMIARLDTDGDGAVSAAEMETMRAEMRDRMRDGHGRGRDDGHGRGRDGGHGWGHGPRDRG